MKKLNLRLCRIASSSTLITVLLTLALYAIAGVVDIPSDSPLANPNYIIRPLNDVSAPYDAVITEEEMATMPVNQLYNGEDWLTPIIFYGLAYVIVTILLIRFIPSSDIFGGVVLWASSTLFTFRELSRIIAEIPFHYSHLRSGAQILIDSNYHLRVIFAYVELWCRNRHRVYATNIANWVSLGIFLVSGVTAGIIDLLIWWRKKKKAS